MATPELLAQGERQLCRLRRARFIEGHLWVQDKVGSVRKLSPLKRFQKRLLNLLEYIRDVQGKPARVIILKGRKIGSSTLFAADQYCEVRDKGINGMIIAHDDETSKVLLNMTHLFYEKDDLYDRPEMARGSVNEIVFRQFAGKIVVSTANNVKAATGQTIQYLLASEGAKWARGEETAASLLQAVANVPGTTVIIESTAWGFDGFFQPKWKMAHDNCAVTFDDNDKPTITILDADAWNGYVPLFISVNEDPDCHLAFESEEEKARLISTLDDHERHLIEAQGFDCEYIKYRRWTLKNECGGDEDIYNQEHPETPEIAFISSGHSKFNRAAISQMPIELGRFGRLEEVSRGWAKKIEFREESGCKSAEAACKRGLVNIFRFPVIGHRYVGALDTSEGLNDESGKNPDATVAHFYDVDAAGEQVAVLAGQISESDILDPFWLLCRWYNMAFAVIERNNTGIYACQRIIEPPYSYPPDRLYHLDDWDKKGRRMQRAVGWRTTVPSRNILIGTLATFMESGAMRVHSAKTQEELLHFVVKNGKPQADTGFHDDHVFAAGMGCLGMQAYPVSLDIRHRPFEQLVGLTSRGPKKPELDGYGQKGDL